MVESCYYRNPLIFLRGTAINNRVNQRVHQQQSINLQNAFWFVTRYINKGNIFESCKNIAGFKFNLHNSNKDRKSISLKYKAFAQRTFHRFLYKTRTDSVFHREHDLPARPTV